MRAALLTNNSSLKFFGEKLGFNVLHLNGLFGNSNSPPALSVDNLASELLNLLGFQEGKIMDSSQFDLLILHIVSGENLNDDKGKAAVNDRILKETNDDITIRNDRSKPKLGDIQDQDHPGRQQRNDDITDQQLPFKGRTIKV